MCNLYSLTKGQAAIVALVRAMRDRTGNLPPIRRALQPSALFKCRKINSRWGIPSTQAIAGAKLQSDLLP
jgi:hypothetical protein